MTTLRLLWLHVASCVAAAVPETFPRYGCGAGHDHYPFCDTQLNIDERVHDLISRLTLEEKPLLMVARESPLGNVSRLGIPQFNWGPNCQHVVSARCGRGTRGEPRCPTPFPQPNFLGATFNESVWRSMGEVLGSELRALWIQGVGENRPPTQLPPLGLDCWSPNINLVRDPRWGRNLETPSEDPYVLGRFGSAVVRAVQYGEDPKYLRAVATVKHFVANSLEGPWPGPGGPASYPGTGLCPGQTCTRHTIDVNISAFDLASSYMPAFKTSVVEGGALGVMCSYNSVNGTPSCANQWLLEQKLRKEWGFEGYVAADTGAVGDIFKHHYYTPTMSDAVVAALEAGTDVESANFKNGRAWRTGGNYIRLIPGAVRDGRLAEATVDAALARSLRLRFRLGLFDPPAGQIYEHTSPNVVRSRKHLSAALEAAEQGLVLLQNREVGSRPVLPVSGRVALIGPHATSRRELLGNYNGQPCPGLSAKGEYVYDCVQTLLEAFGNLTQVTHAAGLANLTSGSTELFAEAVAVARKADVVVLALGLDAIALEGESRDRKRLTLPEGQLALFDAVRSAGRPVVVVLLNGGAVAMSHFKQYAEGIVEAWYPGFFGASALARAIVGQSNRWGKLPVTIYDESFEEVDMLSFDMTKAPGRTYRFYTGTPLWPFGYGLSYTTFRLQLLSSPSLAIGTKSRKAEVAVELRNTGHREGDEVLMAFFEAQGAFPAGSKAALLQRQLFAFQRLTLAAGQVEAVQFPVRSEDFAVFNDEGDKVIYPGTYEVRITNGHTAVSVLVQVAGRSPLVLERWVPASEERIVV